MAWNEGIKAFVANEDLEANRRVKVLSTGKVAYADADAAGDGVTLYDVAAGDGVAVKLINCPGTFEMAAAGAITLGADAYAAADGKIQTLPADEGTYYLVCKTFEAATQNGEIIEVMPVKPDTTKVEVGGITSFVANEDLVANRRVKVLSTGKVAYADADTAGDGVALHAADADDSVSVKLNNCPGVFDMVAAGAITVGADVYAAADGKVQALPVGNGSYYLVGKAFEAAALDDDVIEVLPVQPEVANVVSN